MPTSGKWEQGRMLIFIFVGGRAYTHIYLYSNVYTLPCLRLSEKFQYNRIYIEVRT
jgi:hypothetical protein